VVREPMLLLFLLFLLFLQEIISGDMVSTAELLRFCERGETNNSG
jgi:hypothetical protein